MPRAKKIIQGDEPQTPVPQKTPRTRTSRKIEKENISVPETIQVRKHANKKSPLFFIGIVLTIILAGVGSVMLGKSDKGEINVSATIQNSNQARIDAGEAPSDANPVREEFRNKENGGLVPQSSTGEGEMQNEIQSQVSTTTSAESASSTSTTTEQTSAE